MHSELQPLYAKFNKDLSEEDKERLENGMYRELRASDGVPDKPRPAADAEEIASFWANKAIVDEKTRLGAGPREQEAVSEFREFLRSKNKEHLLDYTIFDRADDLASRNGLYVDRAVGAAEIGAGVMGGASVVGIVTGGLLIHSGYSRLGGVDRSDAPIRVIRSFEAPVGESYIHRKAEGLARDTALALGAGKLIGEGAKLAMPALSKAAGKFSVTKAGAGAPVTTAEVIKPAAAGAGAPPPATAAEVKAAGGAGEVKPVKLRGAANPKVRETAAYGRFKHRELSEKVFKKDDRWKSEPKDLWDPFTGKQVIPDVISPSGAPIELKPNTASGRRQGKKQLEKYERATGKKGRVIYYDRK